MVSIQDKRKGSASKKNDRKFPFQGNTVSSRKENMLLKMQVKQLGKALEDEKRAHAKTQERLKVIKAEITLPASTYDSVGGISRLVKSSIKLDSCDRKDTGLITLICTGVRDNFDQLIELINQKFPQGKKLATYHPVA